MWIVQGNNRFPAPLFCSILGLGPGAGHGPSRRCGAQGAAVHVPGTWGRKGEGIVADHHGKNLLQLDRFSPTLSWLSRLKLDWKRIFKANTVCFFRVFTMYMYHAICFSSVNQCFQNLDGLKSGGETQTSNGLLKVEKQAWLCSSVHWCRIRPSAGTRKQWWFFSRTRYCFLKLAPVIPSHRSQQSLVRF